MAVERVTELPTWPFEMAIPDARHLWSVARGRLRAKERQRASAKFDEFQFAESHDAAVARQRDIIERLDAWLEAHDPEWPEIRAARQAGVTRAVYQRPPRKRNP
jgi:hypothetical protein